MASWLQEAHIAKLQGALDAGGDASLQNAMNLAIESLRSIPPYGHREVTALSCRCSSSEMLSELVSWALLLSGGLSRLSIRLWENLSRMIAQGAC